MKIENDKVGLLLFTLKDADGNMLDGSGDAPISYLHGHNNLIPMLEKELEGKASGDKFVCNIPAADAYGEIDPDMIQAGVPKSMFQGVENLEVGMKFEAQHGGTVHLVTITEVTEETVTVDANHELAGLDLVFDVEVTGVRDATEAELEQGHTQVPSENSCCSAGDGCCS